MTSPSPVEAVNAFAVFVRTILAIVLVAFALNHWDQVYSWLSGVTSLKTGFGEIQRQIDPVSAQSSFLAFQSSLTADSEFQAGNLQGARSAIRLARYVAPAIVGAQILWIDPRPDKLIDANDVMNAIGVTVTFAKNTDEAMTLFKKRDYDLVISNLGHRQEDMVPKTNLNLCPASIFGAMPAEFSDASQIPGVARAELLAQADSRFADHYSPRIIFFSGHGTGKVADLCSRLVTNRLDTLLQAVVSALAELRWSKLPILDTASHG